MRKLLCLLVALVACLMLATVASAETAVPTTCEACGGQEVTWVELTSSQTWKTLDEGHYHFYLSGNSSVYRYTPNPRSTDPASSSNSKNPVTICLDLNGYHISTSGRAIGVYRDCVLNIMDSSEAQTGYIEGGHGSNNLVGGTIFSYGELNLYSGTLRYSNAGSKENSCYGGGVISMGDYSVAVFNMYGGRVEGGTVIKNASGVSRGGTLYAAAGTINLQGGEILSGAVAEGKNGPCFYLNGAVKLNLSGNANLEHVYINSSSAKININGTYSGKTRVTYDKNITLSDGKVIGTATNTPNLTGDLFCTSGDGWIPVVDGENLKLTPYTSCGEWHYCQHCKEIRRWTAMTSSNYTTPKTTAGTYHYYLSGKLARYVEAGKSGVCSTVCLDLYGNTIQPSTGRALLTGGGSTLNLMDTVGGGQVIGSKGGNNYQTGGTMTVSSNTTFNLYGGTMKLAYNEETQTYKGGVIYINGTMNMYGGTVEGAQINDSTSTEMGAAIALKDANASLYISGGEVTNGILPASGKGACIHTAAGALTLTGDPTIANIYTTSKSNITVSGDFTGTASVTYSSAPALGDAVGISDNARVLGEITCTNGDWLIKPEGEKLIITLDAPVVIVDGENEIPCETLQDAIDTYEGGYLMLLENITEDVTVSKDIILDLNGYAITGTVAVSEGATLYGKDSQTDDYAVSDGVYGTLSGSGNVVAQSGYLLVDKEGQKSFHRITYQINTMTLRSEKAGIYYKCSFLGDEMVAEEVESFGVAVSVRETPTADNLNSQCKYSEFTEFEAGAAGNATSSTLVKNILKTTNSDFVNNRNMNMVIYGRAYIKTADGYQFSPVQKRNLTQQMRDVDDIFATLKPKQRFVLMEMYETYRSVLAPLSLTNIVGEETRNENTLSLMMVGNSFCYYYVEELYGLLMANPDPNRGYDAVEIYNLYYSGCTLAQHYEWWTNGTAKYELYKTDENGRKKQTPETGEAWTLEEALIQGQWDYMSLQGMSTGVNYANGNVEENGAYISAKATPLLGRFHELFPDAQLLWHRTWPFEVGRISSGVAYTEESLAKYNAGMQATCDWMCTVFDQDKPYDLQIVNSGAAWPIARAENARLENSLIPDGGLCARLGVRNESTFPYLQGNNNAGDGYHDGDIGGGQFLNACVWYEKLTGQSCLDNPYKPTTIKGTYEVSGKYELSDAFAQLLREAAHDVMDS